MKSIFTRFILLFLITISYTYCYSQVNNDSLIQILTSKTFTIEEEYIGDWGGHLQIFIFKIEDNNVRVKCKNVEPLDNTKELDTLLSINVLKNLEKIFIDCTTKIKTSKNVSTEHILYKFKNENISYIIDDKYTMECNDTFKEWKKYF